MYAKTTNPNPSPIGVGFGFVLFVGGLQKILSALYYSTAFNSFSNTSAKR